MSTFCESPCLIANEPTICKSRMCLIRHSARGDRVATELLFERVYAAVYQQAQRICHGGEDARDLAQETLVLAFEGLAHWRNPQLLLHWMSTIAWNRHRERHRSGRFAPKSIGEYPDSRHSGLFCVPDQPVDPLVLREIAETLAGAVRALPPSLYVTFQMRVLEQRSTRETATRLDTTETTVKARLGRARRLLRDSLEQPGCLEVALTTPVLRLER